MGKRALSFDKSRGFTLIELMVVVAIVAAIAAFAYPAYLDYVIKSNRAVAKSELLSIASEQEQYFANNKEYTEGLTDLGLAADPFCFDQQGDSVAQANAIYCITETDGAADPKLNFTLSASQAGTSVDGGNLEDTQCGNLGVDETGLKTAGGDADKCW